MARRPHALSTVNFLSTPFVADVTADSHYKALILYWKFSSTDGLGNMDVTRVKLNRECVDSVDRYLGRNVC